ncbi:MAG TPA: metallophosphoesterase family protein [Pseudomonadales bacterium]|nr:metallophosphoesterase family protein [Pseudomonadales bacterium]
MERCVAVLADTHDLLRDELRAALAGADHLIHAGDLCSAAILAEFAAMAPLTVVRGNNDRGAWADALTDTAAVELAGVHIWVCHDRADLERWPAPAGTDLVVVGHSHRPYLEDGDPRTGRPAILNPGSPGRRRFSLPVSFARLRLGAGAWQAEIVELEVPPARPRRRRQQGSSNA